MQVYDRRTTGMHWQKHKDGAGQARGYESEGRRMEVAAAIGCDPATVFSGDRPLPPGSRSFSSPDSCAARRSPLVPGKTVDLLVPAEAEIVLEGYVDPGERRAGGPVRRPHRLLLARRRFPGLPRDGRDAPPRAGLPDDDRGQPPMEDGFLGEAVERLFLPLVKKTIPEIVDMYLPVEGIFHNLMIVAIDKRFPGHARKTMHAIWGTGQMMFSKTVVVVDRDVDLRSAPGASLARFDGDRSGARHRVRARARG